MPPLASHASEQWGKAMEQKIAPRLSPAQRRHIQRFSHGAFHCRLSSLLIRFLLLRHIPPGYNLDMDKNGACFIAGYPAGISISHGQTATFAALYLPDKKMYCQLGLDVECSAPVPYQNAFFPCLRKIIPSGHSDPPDGDGIRQWTFYEALCKLDNGIIPLHRHNPAFREIFWHMKNRGDFQLAGQNYFYHFFRWQNHILSIVARKNIFSPIKFVWHPDSTIRTTLLPTEVQITSGDI